LQKILVSLIGILFSF